MTKLAISPDNSRSKSEKVMMRPGDFELWLFVQNWLPRFCCDSPKRCKEQNKKGANRLGTHGLWPAYTTPLKTGEAFPSFCISFISTAQLSAIGTNDGFLLHEWSKHGSCSTLHPAQYFNEIARIEKGMAHNDIHNLLTNAASGTLKTSLIQDKLGGPQKAAISSNKYCQLKEITTCFRSRIDGTAGEQIECPDYIINGSRNSAITIYKCIHIAVDTAKHDEECMFVTKELLREMKRNSFERDEKKL